MEYKRLIEKRNRLECLKTRDEISESGLEMLEELNQVLQSLQSCVMPCFSAEQIERINKYARHQYNRGVLDIGLVSFEEWVNKA